MPGATVSLVADDDSVEDGVKIEIFLAKDRKFKFEVEKDCTIGDLKDEWLRLNFHVSDLLLVLVSFLSFAL